METKNRWAVRQVASAAAVALSLVFVGLEIRQNTAAQRAQTRQDLSTASRELILTASGNPELLEVFSCLYGDEKGARTGRETPDELPNCSSLTRLDTIQAMLLMRANVRNVENVFLQSREGVVDRSVLGTYGFRSPVFTSPEFKRYWSRVRGQFDASFAEAFEEANGLR